MSCDIHLFDRETKQTAMSMNWLRNPFGLVQWAEDNAHHVWGKVPSKRLWYVVNHWSYHKSPRVNRPLFKRVVDQYAAALAEMDTTYFFFDAADYSHFIAPVQAVLDLSRCYHEYGDLFTGHFNPIYGRLMIPVDSMHDVKSVTLSPDSTIGYQQWFRELVKFAGLLQDKRYSFYCDN